MQSLVRTVEPTVEPVSIEEAMGQTRVDDPAELPTLARLIATARAMVEDFTGRALLTQTWKLTLPEWPEGQLFRGVYANAIVLERTPLASVTSVKYYPASGAAQATLSASAYHALTGPAPGMVVLKTTEDWPSLYERPDAVEVTFVAGVATAAEVPPTLRHAVLMLIADLYEFRNQTIVGNIVNQLPHIKNLLESQRVGGWVA